MAGAMSGKVALVTGASSGIGEAAAIALAEAGASVAVSARRADRLEALVARIEAAGSRGLAIPGNIAEEAAATRAVRDTVDTFGRLDILINSAGIIRPGGIGTADLDTWREVIDINLMGTIYTCKAAVEPMKAQGSGDIINISSTSGRRAAGIFGPYSTSKFGLTGFTEGIRQELGSFGIRVCIIEPGAVTTEVADSIEDPTIRAQLQRHVGKEGAMKPEDIAAAIMFAVTLPPRANISQMLIRPTIDVAPM